MKKINLLMAFGLLIATSSFGAYHKLGEDIYLSSTEKPRSKTNQSDTPPFTNISFQGCNTSFLLSADAYTNCRSENISVGGMLILKSNQTEKATVEVINSNSNGYDIKKSKYYNGYANNLSYYIMASVPLGYVARVNAYVSWSD